MKFRHLFLIFFLILMIQFTAPTIGLAQGEPGGGPQAITPVPDALAPENTGPDAVTSGVTVTKVWTTANRDNAPEQTIFNSGDGIRYFVEVYNTTGSEAPIYFNWRLDTPCSAQTLFANNWKTGNGAVWWYLSSSIPQDACPGSYTFRVSVTYNGHTSSQSTQFTVGATNGQPDYNTPFITDEQLKNYHAMAVSEIRDFLTRHNSYFRQPIRDVDGVVFDPPVVIQQAAQQYHINPQVILVTLQKEHSGVSNSNPPSVTGMKALMGCSWGHTAREQLQCAAERFRHYHDQLNDRGYTTSGWRVGVAKRTQDGVMVAPATKAVAGQFTYTPYAGAQWGGNQPQWGGVYLFYHYWREYGFGDSGGDGSCPTITQWKGEYWNNQNLSGAVNKCRNDANINFDWQGGSPDGSISNDHFSARWTRRLPFDSGRYRFKTISDDGIRVWVDGHNVIDAWVNQAPTPHSGEITLSSGDHDVKVEYFENGGGAVAKLGWERISGGGDTSCSGQYRAEYFNNRNLSGSPVYTRCEGWPINHDWGGGSPGHSVPNDNFSARWTGQAHIDSGSYTFIARADDGIRLWLDGQIILDKWIDQGPTEYRVSRNVNSGEHTVKIEYYEHGGGAVAQFRWEKSSGGNNGRTYEIVAKHSGKCLDVEGARPDNGANVQQWACGGGSNQRWRLEDSGGGYYKVVAVHSGKCLDVTGASSNNGANALQWDCNGGSNQLWRFDQVGDAYRITPKHSGKSLDVAGASPNNGANVQQWQYGGGANQLWRLVER